MVTKLKKVCGGIVVLLIGTIVIVLYVTGEHHVKSLTDCFGAVLVLALLKRKRSRKPKNRRIMHGLLETNLLLDFEGLPKQEVVSNKI